MTISRTYSVITVSRNLTTKEFEIIKVKDLTELEAKNYIRIAIGRDGFGVIINKVFPSAYPEFTKLTKSIVNSYIEAMNSGNFKQILKVYDKFDKIGMKTSVNY